MAITMTEAEVRQCLDLMKASADKAGLEEREYIIDYETVSRDAIRNAVKDAKASVAAQGARTAPPPATAPESEGF